MRLADVAGQQAAKAHFLAALQQGRLAHALSLRGPAGVGKLPLAWAMAQYLLCHQPGPTDACGTCPACHKVAGMVHPDLHLLIPYFKKDSGDDGLDGAMTLFRQTLATQPYLTLAQWMDATEGSNKQVFIPIADVRTLARRLQLHAYEGGRRVVIIWHAERLRLEAANALLKLLEEPPQSTHIILTLEEPALLLPTLQSRCQTVPIRPLPAEDLAAWLQQHEHLTPEQALQLAHQAEGSASTALEMARLASEPQHEVLQAWFRACYSGKIETLQDLADQLGRQPREAQRTLLGSALRLMHAILLHRVGTPQLVALAPTEAALVQGMAKSLSPAGIDTLAAALEQAHLQIGRNANGPMTWLHLGLASHPAFRRGAN